VFCQNFWPLASDVVDMVEYLSEVVADLGRFEPLRNGSPPGNGKQRSEQKRKKKRLGSAGQQHDELFSECFKLGNGFLLAFGDLHDRLLAGKVSPAKTNLYTMSRSIVKSNWIIFQTFLGKYR